jgi:superfamily II DNA/RNA helicase
MAPTRELCQQIYLEAKKFSKASEIHVAGCYGGASKNEQRLDLLKGAEIVVATPGRFIDMLKGKVQKALPV